MIPEAFIQELVNRIDIVDVIDRNVPLKKAGANYQACCPFHNEKSPSFTVSPSKQFYHCFGCGAHGSAIGFLMEYQGLSFVEAVQELAKMAGMIVPQEQRDPDKPQVKLMPGLQEALQSAALYYKAELKKSTRAIDYLKGRGLSGQIAARFQIGYAPAGWQNLATVFDDYQHDGLKTVGLVIDNEQGRRYDRFRDRIMFPIHDSKGQVIGFGGRVIESEDDGPKYLNSPETPLFQKGHELYGLFQARRAIREAACALVVEGYMDVVALAQYGIDYAVAALGTATTPFHIQKLTRQTDHIVFCFDGDAAGQKAAWRAAMNALPALTDSLRLSFLFLPKEHDPDSFVREFGKEAFGAAIERALPFSQYLIQQLSVDNPLQAQEDRVRFLNEAEPILQQIQAPRLALLLRKRVAELAGLSQTELEQNMQLKAPTVRRSAGARADRSAPVLLGKLLEILLHAPELAVQLDDALIVGVTPEAQLLRSLRREIQRQPGLSSAVLFEQLQAEMPERYRQQLSAKMMESVAPELLTTEFEGALSQLRRLQERESSEAVDLLRIAQEQGLQALTDAQRALLKQSRWGHRKEPQ
ncbi:DNA primase [Pseudomethylobacillus aquaticus]|uniref:DNA primase n=1 Tax=Pseudomethylobacillus aquaticus TaxID=2676064 RepID=A0A3N0V463_9PROT|nr:DNA primase [Pseudomethylobacillus aquaticus]ROH87331.1 DNA primase [Pseudomethylobacillus aquaticus]